MSDYNTIAKHLYGVKNSFLYEATVTKDDKKKEYYRGLAAGLDIALATMEAMSEVEAEAERLFQRFQGLKLEM